MTITPDQKRKISEVVSIFETSKRAGDPAKVTILKDWKQPDDTRIEQITYGRMQTTESGKLKQLLTMYVANNGKHAAGIRPYLAKLGKLPSLCKDQALLNMLKDAGLTDPVMLATQDAFFDQYYWKPALDWANANGFSQGLSMLVIFDSYIHSGSVPTFLRNKFPAVPPIKGGTDQQWVSEYVNARHDWLANHTDPILRKTKYRTECFKRLIQSNDWGLSGAIDANGMMVS